MTAPAPEATPADQTVGQGDVVDPAVEAAADKKAPAQEPDWKAQARKWEDQAKANKKAADELAALKKAQMTEAEQAAATAKEREAEAERLRTENARYKAAVQHGISEQYMDLLGNGTEDEILARAELVGTLEDAVTELEQLKASLAQDSTPGPVPGLRPGSPVAPDSSYPTSWFPGMNKGRRNSLAGETNNT